MLRKNKKVFWLVLFISLTSIVLYISTKNGSLFKRTPIIIHTQRVEQGIGPNAQTYIINKDKPGTKASPFEAPVVVAVFIIWIITYIGLVTAFRRNGIVLAIDIFFGIPALLLCWYVVVLALHD